MQQQEKVARMIEELSKLGYTMQDLADLVRVLGKACYEESESIEMEEDAYCSKKLEIRITELLKEIGISINLAGFNFIRKAIIMNILYQKRYSKHIQLKEVYKKLAIQYKTEPSKVQRAIRNAVETTLDNMEPKDIKKYFGNTVAYPKGIPNNAGFIAALTDYLLLEGF